MSMFITFTWRHPTFSSRGLGTARAQGGSGPRRLGLKVPRGLRGLGGSRPGQRRAQGPRHKVRGRARRTTQQHTPRLARIGDRGDQPQPSAALRFACEPRPASLTATQSGARASACAKARPRPPICLSWSPRPDAAARRLRTPPVLARCAFGLRQSLALRAVKRAKLAHEHCALGARRSEVGRASLPQISLSTPSSRAKAKSDQRRAR
jgi:hypothetical protein